MSKPQLLLAFRLPEPGIPGPAFLTREFNGKRYAVRKGYRLVPCEGACKNPFNDHCLSCAPLWGVKAVPDE